MKRIISIFLLCALCAMSASAVEFDTNIDNTIRQEYNLPENTVPDEALPPLPNVVPTSSMVEIPQTSAYNPTGKTYTLKGGTKLALVSTSNMSDRLKKGAHVAFKTTSNVITKEGKTIPTGTIVKALVSDAHAPQLTGNGGLIELQINEIYFNGIKSSINTKVSMANSKRIFYSNIKGQRSYWKNFGKAMKPGTKFFKGAEKVSGVMYRVPIVNLLSFVPILGGTVVYTVNFVAAPVVAIFTKGGNLYIPSGTPFEAKLIGENIIKG